MLHARAPALSVAVVLFSPLYKDPPVTRKCSHIREVFCITYKFPYWLILKA